MKMKYLRILLTISLCVTAYFGDYIVFKSKYSKSQLFRALTDSTVHAAIGTLSALLFFSNNVNLTRQACIYNTIFCTILSSLIDIDHFIVAKSFHLKDLTNLKQRGLFHCTTFWIAVTVILIIYSHVSRKLNVYILTYMIVLAFTSHHIRDGNRRGLWVYPKGHTLPINKFLYVFLICTLPTVFAWLFSCTRPLFKSTVIQYAAV